ncbi:Bacteroides conjugative transposon TraM protein [Arachidicoccus rhizosphaerae]|uniref:Bacteroides conjugative transposon TraM protein n=1 Tax=Arachidicoccus rhizosphaerae TaxID=551991 RepID=A0A1H3YUK1_9BACT|nr:conjugative transposon protein TraM [Arachidicoccus rhizosphaerae]SEA15090.1 Bacteroides conjugative transposon TraM protein [Arachidicoccus rhizosphaerae]
MTEINPISQQLKKRRQLLLVLPLLILPFVTLAFWALGGGKGSGKDDNTQPSAVGINSDVPEANVSFRPEDKMSAYLDADRKEEARMQALGRFSYPEGKDSVMGNIRPLEEEVQDPNSLKVEQKLADLQKVLDASSSLQQQGMASVPSINPATYGLQPGEYPPDEGVEQISRLNQLNDLIARSAASGSSGDDNDDGEGQDGDMQQVNTMLDKILAIQHPDKAAEDLKKRSGADKGRVYSMQSAPEYWKVPVLQSALKPESGKPLVKPMMNTDSVDSVGSVTVGSTVSSKGPGQGSGAGGLSSVPFSIQPPTGACAFYDIDPDDAVKREAHYTVQAVIAGSQTLVSGAAVKMRLTADVFINGIRIPKDNFVYGTGTVNGERLKVTISHIRFKDQIFPVDMKVYDLDGMEGIRIPGAIGRDASKEGADRALQSVQMMSLDPGITAQAAAAGIEVTKGLLSKKVKLIRVTVKAGYPILLLDEQGLQKEIQ